MSEGCTTTGEATRVCQSIKRLSSAYFRNESFDTFVICFKRAYFLGLLCVGLPILDDFSGKGDRPSKLPEEGGRPSKLPEEGGRPPKLPEEGGRPSKLPEEGGRPPKLPEKGGRPSKLPEEGRIRHFPQEKLMFIADEPKPGQTTVLTGISFFF